MFIGKINLFNWLSHEDATLDMASLVSLRGENGAGKTSVQSALEILLTGRCVSTDDKGSGAKDLIRRGTDKCAITIDLRDRALLGDRLVKMRCSVTEKSGRTVQVKDPNDPAWTGSDFTNTLAAKREILDCLINGRYFTEMDDARQQKLLAAIVLPQTIEWEPWVQKAMADCEMRIDWSIKASDLIAAAYDKAFKERTLVNRMLKEWKEPETPPAASTDDLDAINNRLRERRQQKSDLDSKRGQILAQFTSKIQERARLVQEAQQLQRRLTEEQDRKKTVGKDILSTADLKKRQAAASGAKEAARLDGEIAVIQAKIAVVTKFLQLFDKVSEVAKCPTCQQAIPEEHFNQVASHYIGKKDEAIEAERKLQEQRKALGDPAGSQGVLDAHERAEKDLKLVVKHIEETEESIRETKAKIEAIGEIKEDDKPDTSAIDAELADMESRIARGSAAFEAAIRAKTAREEYDKNVAARAKLTKKQETLEKLVAYFGPGDKGVQAKVLDQHTEAFQESMNTFLAGWNFKCSLKFEPYSFRAGLVNGDEMFTLRAMSDGQRAMFAAAFQVALAKVTGFNFVCVDAAEVFSNENRITLFKNLMAAKLDQAIVIAADVRREIPNRPNTVFYMFTLDKSGAVPTSKVERLT